MRKFSTKTRLELCRALAFKPVKSKYYRNYRDFPVVYDMRSRFDGNVSEYYQVIAENGDTYHVDENGYVSDFFQWDDVIDGESQSVMEKNDGSGYELETMKNGNLTSIDISVAELPENRVAELDKCLIDVIGNVSSAKQKKVKNILNVA